MAIRRQDCIQDINVDLLDDVSNHPPPLPPRKPLKTQEKLTEEQNRNRNSNPRLPETVNLMTFPNDNEDTNKLAASWDVCTGNAFDYIIPECTLLNLSGNSETDETHHKIHSGLKTNMFDSLDKYLIGELFKQSSDLNTETRPMFYTPDFSTCSRGIDALQPANSVDLPTLLGERENKQSDSFEVIDSTESITHIMHTPSQSSKLNAMENQSDSASSIRSCAFLNGYFRANSIYSLDDTNPTNSMETIQYSDTKSEEQDDIWGTPKLGQQDVYLKKLREQEVNHIQQLQRDTSTTKAPGLLNIHHPKLSSQRSVSESDINNSIEFENTETRPMLYTPKRSSAFLKSYFRENSNFHLEDVNPPVTSKNIQDYDTESGEKDDIWDMPTSRQQDLYLKKIRELEQEVNQIQQLQKSSTQTLEESSIHRPKFYSQRSLSDSDIYVSLDFEDNMGGQDITNEWIAVKSNNHDMKKSSSIDNLNRRTKKVRSSTTKHDPPSMGASSSFENIKTKPTKLWRKITKRDKDNSDGTSQKVSIKVDAWVELSCPCERSCERIKRLVTTQGGYMWVAFIQCSWVFLYNNRHERVYKFDTRGCVDSLAVSATGVLYVSCPPQKRVIMLSSNLQMTVLRSFTKLYPRGIAVSPYDGTLIVCMTSQPVGHDMEEPSKDSCLMQFKGETPKETGTIVNKGNYFGYPVKVTINMNGLLLVSDFGLRCLFVLDKGGYMLRTFSSLGGVPLWHVHALTSNPVSSFYVVQGGAGTLSITRLGEYLGTFEETSTSTKDERLVKHKVETASMNTDGQIVVASGNIITHVSLVYS
ncbi:uncharacterized protein LOC110445810 isoform X2 [Mizuhopecten yessoensis]|uniref:uncharacterized protein LOC110445810 isoform X2 n=1 Tax=Mizuhopecten yessoensis TaxID=6573 RepID=UPI000B457E79|nr:uncharacterized protein LOC110445810 isoform X2 [Mizuhopecten yessoensis]